jgi:hypothetical protein
MRGILKIFSENFRLFQSDLGFFLTMCGILLVIFSEFSIFLKVLILFEVIFRAIEAFFKLM